MSAAGNFFWDSITTEGDAMEHQCTDCTFGQAQGCRCSHTDPVPSAGAIAALAVGLVAAALVFGIGVGQVITWVVR